jgi:hypothetical protein
VRRLGVLFVTCLAAGCGGGSGESGGGSTAGAPALSVREAAAAEPGKVVLVRGALHVDSGHVRLCTRLDDSYPPRCAGASLRVHGLAYDAVEGIQTSPDESMHWAPAVVVSARMEEGGALRAE